MARPLKEKLRKLPSVDQVLKSAEIRKLLKESPRRVVVDAIREELGETRKRVLGRGKKVPSIKALAVGAAKRVEESMRPSLRRVINGLGIVLHTGLGRAPLPKAAQRALFEVSEGYCNLEIEEETGRRGDRYEHVAGLLMKITGAEAAMIVNNNAAATLLTLNTLADGKEVVVSRGQLIEIGGSFRLPEIIKRSGAKLVEVGTTNRTYLKDYRQAITEETAAILKVHPSNYRIMGFTSEVPLSELVQLGGEFSLPIVDDLGSGALVDLSKYGLPKEPVVQESIETGADLVIFSGDKLTGGPQAGVIVGKKHHVDELKENQLTRALRCDKLTYAAMEATLRLFLDEESLKGKHPVISTLLKPLTMIEREAKKLIGKLRKSSAEVCEVELVDGFSEVGGGSLATESIPTKLVAVKPRRLAVDELAKRLRFYDPSIYARIEENRLVLDLRTIREDEIEMVAQGVAESLRPDS